jgi:hypothetical protein
MNTYIHTQHQVQYALYNYNIIRPYQCAVGLSDRFALSWSDKAASSWNMLGFVRPFSTWPSAADASRRQTTVDIFSRCSSDNSSVWQLYSMLTETLRLAHTVTVGWALILGMEKVLIRGKEHGGLRSREFVTSSLSSARCRLVRLMLPRLLFFVKRTDCPVPIVMPNCGQC